ncbi:YegP family protein [Crocinitomicaceae bacterium]|nr:YegP family protein [Crocinitomicaceae bacterium]
MGYFILKKSQDGFYSFSLHAKDDESILESGNYESKKEAEDGIESMRTIASFSSRYNQKHTTDNHYYFVLKAANDKVVGKSKYYASRSTLEADVDAVMQLAPLANVIDES